MPDAVDRFDAARDSVLPEPDGRCGQHHLKARLIVAVPSQRAGQGGILVSGNRLELRLDAGLGVPGEQRLDLSNQVAPEPDHPVVGRPGQPARQQRNCSLVELAPGDAGGIAAKALERLELPKLIGRLGLYHAADAAKRCDHPCPLARRANLPAATTPNAVRPRGGGDVARPLRHAILPDRGA